MGRQAAGEMSRARSAGDAGTLATAWAAEVIALPVLVLVSALLEVATGTVLPALGLALALALVVEEEIPG